ISLGLRLAVKIDAVIEPFDATREALLEPPVERLETRRGPGHAGRGTCRSLGRRRRLAGRFRSLGRHGLSAKRRDRACDLTPELALLGIEPAGAPPCFPPCLGRH